jgi:hypothetical protein
MRLPDNPFLPNDLPGVVRRLNELYRTIAQQANALAEGSIYAAHNAATAPPTTGTYAQGDVIRNAQPVEAGTVGSKYVVTGWVCTVGGTPGTWLPLRALTGN